VRSLMSGDEIASYQKNLEHLAMEPGTNDVARFLMNMLDIKEQKA